MRLGRLMSRTLRRLRDARSGAAAVEFALVAPFLLGLMVPLADLGAYIYDYMEIQLAAQAGGEYAARHGWDPTGIQNAILAAAPNLISQITQPCPNPRPICTGTGVQSGVYYTIGAQTFYHTISGFKYPFLANGQVIQGWSIVRVQ